MAVSEVLTFEKTNIEVQPPKSEENIVSASLSASPSASSRYGQFVTYNSKLITSAADKRKVLEVSGNLQIKALSGNGGGVKGNYMSESHNSEKKLTYMIYVKVVDKTELINPRFLTLMPLKLSDTNREKEFYTLYGDACITSRTFGGELLGNIEIIFNSQEEKEKIAAEANFTYGIVSGDGKISRDFKDFTTNKNVSISVTCNGGLITSVPTTIDDLEREAKKYPVTVALNPVIIMGNSTKYTTLVAFQEYVTQASLTAQIEVAMKVINDELADYFYNYTVALSSAEDIISSPKKYQYEDGSIINVKSFKEEYYDFVKTKRSEILTYWANCKSYENPSNVPKVDSIGFLKANLTKGYPVSRDYVGPINFANELTELKKKITDLQNGKFDDKTVTCRAVKIGRWVIKYESDAALCFRDEDADGNKRFAMWNNIYKDL